MKINRTKELALLQKVYFKYTQTLDIDTAERTFFGYVSPKFDPQFMQYFMNWWVDIMDKRLDTLPPYSEQYADIFGQRGIKINELKQVLSGSIKNYFEERFYEYLLITDEKEHEYFKHLHSYDAEKDLTESFLEILTEACKNEIPLLHEFLFKSKMNLYFPISSLKKHTYILAGSGSGKSEIIKNIWYDLQRKSHRNNNKTLMCIEPSRKLTNELLQFHLNAENKERVLLLDTNIRQTAKELLGEDIFEDDYTFIINPLELSKKSELDINATATSISDAIFELMDDTKDNKGQMTTLLKACANLLLEMDNTSLKDLRDMNVQEVPQKYIDSFGLVRNQVRREWLQDSLNNNKLSSSRNGVYHRVHGMIEDMLLARVLIGKSTVDLEKELNSGKIIIINPTSLTRSAKKDFGKLIICLTVGYIDKRDMLNNPFPTFLILDEFQNYLTPTISDLMAEGRKGGLHTILANQNFNQMSSEMSGIAMGNTKIKVASELEGTTLKRMTDAMKGLKTKDFDKLPKHDFFIYNSENKKAGTRVFRASDNFVDIKPPYYMNKKELRTLFEYLVYESGYYVKVQQGQNLTGHQAISEEAKATKINSAIIPKWKQNQ